MNTVTQWFPTTIRKIRTLADNGGETMTEETYSPLSGDDLLQFEAWAKPYDYDLSPATCDCCSYDDPMTEAALQGFIGGYNASTNDMVFEMLSEDCEYATKH